MTRREKITRTIAEWLQNISIANGYRTNTGQYVSVWGTQIIPHKETYDLNLRDTGSERITGSLSQIKYEILIAYSGKNVYKNLCDILADVEKALYDNEEQLNTVLNDTGIRILPSDTEIDITRENDSERGYAKFGFIVEHLYQEKWEPDNNNY
jgi:hypothetical protein